MIEIGTKILDVVCLLFRLIRPGGVQGLIAEVFLLRQQLLVLKREKPKCPPLTTADRLIMGLCTLFMTPKRIGNSAIAIAASTLLDFHRALVSRKYSRLFSKKSRSKPGPKGPSRELIKLVVETKERNPSYGCPRIALLVGNVL
jgi:putative transposase